MKSIKYIIACDDVGWFYKYKFRTGKDRDKNGRWPGETVNPPRERLGGRPRPLRPNQDPI